MAAVNSQAIDIRAGDHFVEPDGALYEVLEDGTFHFLGWLAPPIFGCVDGFAEE